MTHSSLLYLKKQTQTSLFFTQNPPTYLWSNRSSGVIEDISHDLLESLARCYRPEINPYQAFIDEKVKQSHRSKEKKQTTHLWQNTIKHLALETFAELDGLGTWEQQLCIIRDILSFINGEILDSSILSIDFREIFLVTEGESPPAHFRPGIDSCVTNIDEYKKKTARFPYQLARAIFNKFRPTFSSKEQLESNLNQTIIEHYSNNAPPLTQNANYISYTTPLKDYYYFNSPLTAYIHFFYAHSFLHPPTPIITLTYPVQANELIPFLRFSYDRIIYELTIVLKGSQYKKQHERQNIFEEIFQAVKKSNCRTLLNVILITDDTIDDNLLNLRPIIKDKTALFQPLSKDAGYYLSSTQIASAIYRNIQTLSSTTDQWFKYLDDLSQDYKKDPQIKIHPGAYILTNDTIETTRKSKMLTKEQLKSKVRLSLTHHESVAQAQAIHEQIQASYTQQINQSVEESVRFNESYSFHWDSKVNMESFCKQLKAYAKSNLSLFIEQERPLQQIGYLTEFYLKHHSSRGFYEKLSLDPHFCLQVTAKIFGYALIKSNSESNTTHYVKLPHYGIDNIEQNLAEDLIRWSEYLLDGYSETNLNIKDSYLFGRTLYGLKVRYKYNKHLLENPPLVFPKLLYQTLTQPSINDDEQSLPFYSALVAEEEIASLNEVEKAQVIHNAECLLTIFQPHPTLSNDAIDILEKQLLTLIHFYFPNRTEDIQRLETFMRNFTQHNEDNLKILLLILIRKHKEGFARFFKLLAFLEERSLLNYFYKLHFQYATYISSVEQLLDRNCRHTFLSLATITPIEDSPKKWPIFQKLCYHMLLYIAKHNIYCSNSRDFQKKFESLWKRLYIKFMAYTGNQEEEAQQLLTLLAQQLIGEEDLSIAPLTNIQTFFVGLENLLDHAMANHVLKEQLDEIRGISLLPMDAPYAHRWNGFQVISPEMNLYSEAINPITKTYAVSKTELLDTIVNHQPEDPALKVAVFRYLGTQNFREELAFYRNLYQEMIKSAVNKNAVYLAELLWAYYAATISGSEYCRPVNQANFSKKFMEFLKKHALNQTFTLKQITSNIDELILKTNFIQSDDKTGTQSLWSLWKDTHVSAFRMASTPIPAIFLKKFPAKKLGHFLLTQKEHLQNSLSALSPSSLIVTPLIHVWINEFEGSESHALTVKNLLNELYPKINMTLLLQNINKIASLINALNTLEHCNPNPFIFLALHDLIKINPKIDPFLCLVELTTLELTKHQGQSTKHKLAIHFLLTLSKKPQLYNTLPETKNLLQLLLETYLNIDDKGDPNLFLHLIETLLPLGVEEAQQLFTTLIPLTNHEQGLNFLHTYPNLNAKQLKDITQLLKNINPLSLAIKILDQLYKNNSDQSVTALIDCLEKKPETEIQTLLTLSHEISQQTNQPLLSQLQRLTTKHPQSLKHLARLYQSKLMNTEELLNLLIQPSLEEAIMAFQQTKNKENLQRFHYDASDIKEKIAQIKLKSHQTDKLLSLSDEKQALLWNDFQFILSSMSEKPLHLNINDISKQLTIHELSEIEFLHLFKTLQHQISQGINVHHHQLLIIALSAEALYRTTHKFPRSTQILTLLQCIHSPNNIIHEVKTGEGKSIIAAMHAVLLYGLGKTVDVITENNTLAKNALEKFSPLYDYFGIPHQDNIITSKSAYAEYTPNGINYSTASNLSLFRMRMSLEKKTLPKNSALIADEIDAALTSTVQFRFAANLNPLLNDVESWSQVYKLLLDFVKEKDIYLNNPCNEESDIINLRNYFIAKNPKHSFHKFTQQLSNEWLGVLIESATLAHELEEKKDYFIVKMKEKDKVHYYAAPIINSTKRPDHNVSYSDHVQQLLHTKLNHKNPPPAHPFIVEPSTETIMVNGAKIFFDYYRLHHGTIVGLTGTSGSLTDRTEFYQQQALTAYRYPTFHPDCSENLGLITAFGEEEHLHKTFKWIKQHKQQHPAQPILLITRSPQATDTFCDFMTSHTDWKLQSYHGYEEGSGKSEESIIETAGLDYFLTTANQSLARGADIEPNYENGLLVINTCTDVTPSELEQIQGRAARNGKKGQFISIIDAQNIDKPSSDAETLSIAFKHHQLKISLQQYQDRAKMRLLDEARHLITDRLLKLRKTADKIMSVQFGEAASIVGHKQLLNDLSRFNRDAEKHYTALLEQHNQIDNDVADVFLEARTKDYQQLLEAWLPKEQFSHLQFIEPSIPLDTLPILVPQLPGATVDQIKIFANIFNCQWKQDGHLQIQQNFDRLDKFIEVFDPYFKKKCSLKQAIGHALDKQGLLTEEQLASHVIHIKNTVNELLAYAKSIAVIGQLIPVERIKAFVAVYLTEITTKIHDKKWDEVHLPTIDFTSIGSWFSNINDALSIGSFVMSAIGGPLSFIINRIIIPTVFGWIKNALKKQLANSESLVLQILVNLDDLAKDLSEAINGLAALITDNEVNVGQLLDKIAPITKNKALTFALTKYLELIEMPEYIPLVQAIPAVLPALEAYRDAKPNALLNIHTLMAILQQAARSELILKMLEKSPYQSCLKRITQLNPTIIHQIGQLSPLDFITLIKIIAHPHFFALLEKLPAATTFEQLQQWITSTPPNAPIEIKDALKALHAYQENHERIAEESKQNLLKLHHSFNLTLDTFKGELEKLTPYFKEEITSKTQEVKNSQPKFATTLLNRFKYATLLAISASAILYSALYLSTFTAVTCVILTGWLTFSYFKDPIFTWLYKPKIIPTEKDTKDKEDVLFISYNETPPTMDPILPSAQKVMDETPKRNYSPVIPSVARDLSLSRDNASLGDPSSQAPQDDGRAVTPKQRKHDLDHEKRYQTKEIEHGFFASTKRLQISVESNLPPPILLP